MARYAGALKPLVDGGKTPRREREKRRYFRLHKRNMHLEYCPTWAVTQACDALSFWLAQPLEVKS